MKFPILVPVTSTGHERIKQGSAIIGELAVDPQVAMVSVEGNLYGASNLVRFVDKCLVAAYRQRDNVASMGRFTLPRATLKQVGTFDLERREITEITDPDALREWARDIGDLKA